MDRRLSSRTFTWSLMERQTLMWTPHLLSSNSWPSLRPSLLLARAEMPLSCYPMGLTSMDLPRLLTLSRTWKRQSQCQIQTMEADPRRMRGLQAVPVLLYLVVQRQVETLAKNLQSRTLQLSHRRTRLPHLARMCSWLVLTVTLMLCSTRIQRMQTSTRLREWRRRIALSNWLSTTSSCAKTILLFPILRTHSVIKTWKGTAS